MFAYITIIMSLCVGGMVYVYHIINTHVFMPMLRKMDIKREYRRAMDTTRAHYLQEGGK